MFDYASTHNSTTEVFVLGESQLVADVKALMAPFPQFRVQGKTAMQRGMRHLQEYGADAVIVGTQSSRIDPVRACMNVREQRALQYTPLFVAASSSETSLRRLTRYVGCTDFLSLPLEETELVVRLENYVAARSTSEQLQSRVAGLLLELRKYHTKLNRLGNDLTDMSGHLQRSRELTIQRLAQATELRDDSTGRHTQRVSMYSEMLARRAGIPLTECELIRIGSPLHDVGKIGIPDNILFKPGSLTTDEFDRIKTHPDLGHSMLADTESPLLEMAASIALTHHEKWDGSGYPTGLCGEDIPFEGRVTAIADVFDALTSARCYKRAFSVDESLEIMAKGRAQHFDPELLDLFFDSMPEVNSIRHSMTLN